MSYRRIACLSSATIGRIPALEPDRAVAFARRQAEIARGLRRWHAERG